MDIEVDVSSRSGEMLEGGLKPVPAIPYEFVDDDEMEAIESAFRHAQTLSSGYNSVKNPQVLVNSNFHSTVKNSCSLNTVSSTSSSLVTQHRQSLVYTLKSPSSNNAEEGFCETGGKSSHCSDYQFSSAEPNLDRSLEINTGESQSTVTIASDGNGSVISSGDSVDGVMLGSQNSAPRIDESQNVADMEDIGASVEKTVNGMREKGRQFSFLLRHRAKRGLSVTDFTASEWCEKQVEFSMTKGKPAPTPAMKAGTVRHVQLEVEVVTRVEIEIRTKEDAWATRLLNFISGSRQLLSEGITRELPVLGLLAGTWIVGIIDELRLIEIDGQEYPLLVDTKTRRRKTPPAEPQKRNARLQLMSYKYLWDSMVETGFPFDAFFQHFGLRSHQKFCSDVREHASSFYQDCQIVCLQDLLPQITNEVVNYPRSLDSLLLRYEWQADQSLLGQDEFDYEHEWLMDKWQWHLEFWKGRRQASAVPEEESWKCRHCSFLEVCKPMKEPIDS
ncbi:hypothetical protein R1sor_006064 [Riccia sorocarpa]|uniref:Exonuclease V n=1 Tax=Riccia sorocarpa TaxID=122646 RepID=A0ABD3HLZ0_9MARC